MCLYYQTKNYEVTTRTGYKTFQTQKISNRMIFGKKKTLKRTTIRNGDWVEGKPNTKKYYGLIFYGNGYGLVTSNTTYDILVRWYDTEGDYEGTFKVNPEYFKPITIHAKKGKKTTRLFPNIMDTNKSLPVGKWLDEKDYRQNKNQSYIKDSQYKRYATGFHIYYDEGRSEEYKVEFRQVVAKGYQDNRQVIVAKKIKIISTRHRKRR